MTGRIVPRLIRLLVAVAVASALMVAAPSLLASLGRDQVAVVERTAEASADERRPAPAPSGTVVLLFAGIVLLAALSPVHRVYYRPDWH